MLKKLFISAILLASFPLANYAQTKADSTQSDSTSNQIQHKSCCNKRNEKTNFECDNLNSKKSKENKSDHQRKSLKNQIPPRSEWIMRSENEKRGI